LLTVHLLARFLFGLLYSKPAPRCPFQKFVVLPQIHSRYLDLRSYCQWCVTAQQRAHRLFAQRPPLGQQPDQGALDALFAFHAGQVQQPQVLLVCACRMLRHQSVIAATIGQRWIQLFAVDIAGEGAGLAHQPADDVAIVDAVLVLTPQPRQALHQLLGIPDLDLLQTQAHLDRFADQPRRHRVAIVLDPDRTGATHAHAQPLQALQPRCRQRPQLRTLQRQRCGAPGIAALLHALEQSHVVRPASEVPATTQQQRLLDRVLEMAMRRLHVAILMATGRVGCLALQAIMRQQGRILGGELIGLAIVVHGQRHAIAAMPLRHTAQGPQRILQAGAEAREALGQTNSNVLPVGMRQHKMIHKVSKRSARDRHLQVVHRREIRGRQATGGVHLRKEHFLGRPVLGLPLPHPPLQRSPRRGGALARLRLLQPVPQRLGLQAWFPLQLSGHGGPNFGQRVRPGPPASWLAQFCR
jgi:hypothetical protein